MDSLEELAVSGLFDCLDTIVDVSVPMSLLLRRLRKLKLVNARAFIMNEMTFFDNLIPLTHLELAACVNVSN